MPAFAPSIPYAGTGTWANKPAANAVPAGAIYRATNVGDNGAYFESNGTRWRALNGEATLDLLGAAVSGIVNSETIVLQALLPAGSWQAGDTLSLKFTLTKSGNTDTGIATVRIGTAGTTADTAITGFSANAVFAASGLTGGWEYAIKLTDATNAQKVGNAGSASSAYIGGGTSAIPAATAITDSSANALYVSLGVYSGGATNTVAITSGHIKLLTP